MAAHELSGCNITNRFGTPYPFEVDFFFVAPGSQDGRTTVLEKERIEVETDQEAEDGGLLGTLKNAVG